MAFAEITIFADDFADPGQLSEKKLKPLELNLEAMPDYEVDDLASETLAAVKRFLQQTGTNECLDKKKRKRKMRELNREEEGCAEA